MLAFFKHALGYGHKAYQALKARNTNLHQSLCKITLSFSLKGIEGVSQSLKWHSTVVAMQAERHKDVDFKPNFAAF